MYHDADSYASRLLRLGISKLDLRVESHLRSAMARLKCLRFPINNNQAAIAAAAVQRILGVHRNDKPTRQIYTMPAGHGKSRVPLAIVLMLAYHGRRRTFHLVYSKDELMRKDQRTHKPVVDELQSITVKYHTAKENGSLTVADGAVAIIDEADHVLIDKLYSIIDTTAPNSSAACIQVVGLTATAEEEMDDFEKAFLELDLGFRVFESGIRKEIVDDIERTEPVTLADFIGSEFDSYARLIYVDDASVCSAVGGDDECYMALRDQGYFEDDDRFYRLNCSDVDIIDKLQSNDVLIVTDPTLMRGFDYRCETGMALFIGRKFDSERSRLQALGRVGRYGERCVRTADEQLKTLVDADAAVTLSNRMEALKIKQANALKSLGTRGARIAAQCADLRSFVANQRVGGAGVSSDTGASMAIGQSRNPGRMTSMLG